MSRLKEIRLTKGLTIDGLHELSGVSVGAISGIETGKIRNPNINTLRKLAGALQADLNDLLDPME